MWLYILKKLGGDKRTDLRQNSTEKLHEGLMFHTGIKGENDDEDIWKQLTINKGVYDCLLVI